MAALQRLGAVSALVLAWSVLGADRRLVLTAAPDPATVGGSVRLECLAEGDWSGSLRRAQIWLYDAAGALLVSKAAMQRDGLRAWYGYALSADAPAGTYRFTCRVEDRKRHVVTQSASFQVVLPGGGGGGNEIPEHAAIMRYDGPQTCIACHPEEAQEMLSSLHMTWSGPTPELTNNTGAELGKAVGGINTFCTYAMSSKSACFTCHVRADGNAPDAPQLGDVDCLLCHNDTYQRTFVTDPASAVTVTNVLGETRTYVSGLQESDGDYVTAPDYAKMPAGTTMESLARTVHRPTRASCLRCHAKAGGSDWAKRGDMGMSSAAPAVTEDVHLSPATGGADLTCADCHAPNTHVVAGRGIDLRQTEAPDPSCATCHTSAPHANTTLNRHAQGQVSCQTCHIRAFGKGGATEMARNWLQPAWNPGLCSGQGGFVGHEEKAANVPPEYRWFDGTSYVYNVGEPIQPDADGTYTMARAHGAAFDGKSQIVPIKDHRSVMALHDSGILVPPVIMDMFMTGDFHKAVQAGMAEQGLTGGYSMVEVRAEMLITHGVDPKSLAPSCTECHDGSGTTPDGVRLLPLGQLGYHTWPAEVQSCTLCHSAKTESWQAMHDRHANGESPQLSCKSCHTSEPTGLTRPATSLCSQCHEYKNPSGFDAPEHKKHIAKGYACTVCHAF